MKQHRIICIPTLTFALLLMFTPSILQAQDKPVFPIDSLITCLLYTSDAADE